jgi:hypothetical protein
MPEKILPFLPEREILPFSHDFIVHLAWNVVKENPE